MTDVLRLRTARALGWKCIECHHEVLGWKRAEHPNGGLPHSDCELWEREGKQAYIAVFPDGRVGCATDDMPAYGESWASCAEIDAEIKERGWEWQCYTLDGNVVALISRRASTARGCVIEAIATTFPAAFALAFCRAVEAQGSAQTHQEAP